MRNLTKREIEFINEEVASLENIYYDTNEPVGTKQQVADAAYQSVMEYNGFNKEITFAGTEQIKKQINKYINEECPQEMFTD
jgi:hypothetical protein